MKKAIKSKLLYFLPFLVMIISCEKDDSGFSSTSSATQKVQTIVTGRLVDEAGNPVTGASVELEGISTSTDMMGLFLFKNIGVNKERGVIRFTKSGYIDQHYGFRPSAGKVTYTKPVMIGHESTQVINSSTGGTVSLAGGGTAQFPSNAFVNESGVIYSGSVTVNITLLNPDDDKFFSKIPGRDLRAVDGSGVDKILYSYGMMNVELTGQSSEKLQLAPGVTSTLTFPVSTAQQASAPVSMPVWYLDPETALWMEEGTALKNGNFYTTEVSHFTWWNCDIPYPLASLSGNVISCSGAPAPNMDVYADFNLAYITDNTGHYSGDAPAGYGGFEIFASDWYFIESQYEFIPDLTTGQNYVAPVLNMASSTIDIIAVQGQLKDCNGNPSDGLLVITSPIYGFYNYQYVTGGNFTIFLESNLQYDITAVNSGEYGQASVDLNGAIECSTVSIPDITVCNSISSGNTNLTVTLNSPVFGNQILSYYVANCNVFLTPSPYILMAAIDSVNNSSGTLTLNVSSYQPGNYTWNSSTNSFYFLADLNGTPVTIESEPGGVTTLLSAPAVGGMVNASFNGNVMIFSSQFPAPVPASMTGNFNVVRN